MRKLAIAGLLGLGAESVLAHPGSAHAAQHGIEHLLLALAFFVPALLLLRRHTRNRRLPHRVHEYRRRP